MWKPETSQSVVLDPDSVGRPDVLLSHCFPLADVPDCDSSFFLASLFNFCCTFPCHASLHPGDWWGRTGLWLCLSVCLSVSFRLSFAPPAPSFVIPAFITVPLTKCKKWTWLSGALVVFKKNQIWMNGQRCSKVLGRFFFFLILFNFTWSWFTDP